MKSWYFFMSNLFSAAVYPKILNKLNIPLHPESFLIKDVSLLPPPGYFNLYSIKVFLFQYILVIKYNPLNIIV